MWTETCSPLNHFSEPSRATQLCRAHTQRLPSRFGGHWQGCCLFFQELNAGTGPSGGGPARVTGRLAPGEPVRASRTVAAAGRPAPQRPAAAGLYNLTLDYGKNLRAPTDSVLTQNFRVNFGKSRKTLGELEAPHGLTA